MKYFSDPLFGGKAQLPFWFKVLAVAVTWAAAAYVIFGRPFDVRP